MKRGLSAMLGATLLSIIGYGTYGVYQWMKTPEPVIVKPQATPIQKETKEQKIILSDKFEHPSQQLVNFNIDVKTLTTTKKLADVFDRSSLNDIPQIYVERFPNDFVQEGNTELFVKVMMPLILHENNVIKKDRKFLETLNQKYYSKTPWNDEENIRFNTLKQTYGITEQKIPETQLSELLKRVDIVPPSLVIAISGIQTNWGKQSLTAPFGQKEWIDGKYTEKQFDKLEDAVHSFMMEMNSLPIYFSMWKHRQTYKNLRGSLGEKLIGTVDNFMRDNPAYEQQIKSAFKKYNLTIFDGAVLYE